MVLQLRSLLMLGSAAVIFTAGVLHLVYTFSGSRLQPRDAEFHARRQEVSPVITRRTTMWKVWVGLNASHSFGLILFAAVYAYLALRHAPFLFASIFLLALGVLALRLCRALVGVLVPRPAEAGAARRTAVRALARRALARAGQVMRARASDEPGLSRAAALQCAARTRP
jgi:hypothetical protein